MALGHPIGATGAILAVKLMHEMERRQARYGLVSLCIGGGRASPASSSASPDIVTASRLHFR